MVERLNDGKPILQKVDGHPWENKVTFNPACTLVEERQELERLVASLPFDESVKRSLRSEPALCFLLYRAQGRETSDYDYSRSSLGLAILSADLCLMARCPEPILLPDRDFDNLGIEDPRITKIGDRFIVTYTAYSTGVRANNIRIGLASTKDSSRGKSMVCSMENSTRLITRMRYCFRIS